MNPIRTMITSYVYRSTGQNRSKTTDQKTTSPGPTQGLQRPYCHPVIVRQVLGVAAVSLLELLRAKRLSSVKDLVHLPPWELRDWLLITEAPAMATFSAGWGVNPLTGVFQGLKSPFLVGQQLKCHKFQYFNRAKTCKKNVFNT